MTVKSLVHYLIIRSDLPDGAQLANVGHAAGESAGGSLPEGTIVVVLAVPDEKTLHEIATAIAAQGLPYHLVVEVDPPYAGQAMAIGVVPVIDRVAIKRAVGHLPLAGSSRHRRLARTG